MTRKECFAILELKESASLSDIKRAYRKLAFALHPDLNPHVANAAKKFQRLNEAYVQLSQQPQPTRAQSSAKNPDDNSQHTAKAREEAKKAYSKAKSEFSEKETAHTAEQNSKRRKEDILKDILADPFARRVFQDIYSHVKNEEVTGKKVKQPPKEQESAASAASPDSHSHTNNGMFNKVSAWMRRQIDEDQVIRLPKNSLTPGARIRLEIRHGLSGKTQTIELTLPPNFNPNKAIRLKGMGKRLGSWKGDLFVRIEPI